MEDRNECKRTQKTKEKNPESNQGEKKGERENLYEEEKERSQGLSEVRERMGVYETESRDRESNPSGGTKRVESGRGKTETGGIESCRRRRMHRRYRRNPWKNRSRRGEERRPRPKPTRRMGWKKRKRKEEEAK